MTMNFDTDNIEDAKIVPVEEEKSNDLLSRLSAATDHKQPGSHSASTSSKFWDSSEDDFSSPEPKKDPASAPSADKATEGQKRITVKTKEISARTAVGMLDFTHGLILRPIVNYKFKKKFNADEITRLEASVADAEKTKLEGSDLSLRNKWDSLMKKRDKLIEEIPLTKTEEKDLEEMFYNYFDATEKELPPEWGLALGIISITGKRIVDIAFE